MNTEQKKELLTDINNYIILDATTASGPSPGLLALKTQIEEELKEETENTDTTTNNTTTNNTTTNDTDTYQNATLSDVAIVKTIEDFFTTVNPYMQDFEEFMDELQATMNEYQGYTDED